MSKKPKAKKFIGKGGLPILVRSTHVLETNTVLTMDALYGQQLIVSKKINDKVYEVNLLTNDKEESIASMNFDGNTVWFRVYHIVKGEFSGDPKIDMPRGDMKPLKITLHEDFNKK